jgi:hypothetical protein
MGWGLVEAVVVASDGGAGDLADLERHAGARCRLLGITVNLAWCLSM